MANDDRASRVILKYEVDQASVSNVRRSVSSLLADFKTLEGNVDSVSATTKNLSLQLDALKRQEAIDRLTKEFIEVGKSANNFGAALSGLQAGLKDVGASTFEVTRATLAFGEMERAAKKAASAVDEVPGGATGGSGLGGGLRTAERITKSASRGLGGLHLPGASELGDISDTLQVILAARDSINTIGPAASSAAVGSAAFGAAIIPIAVIAAAAAVAFVAVSEGLKKSREEADHQIAVLDKYYETLRTGSATVVEKQIAETKEQIRLQEAQLAIQKSKVNANLDDPNTSPLQKLLGQVAGDTKEWSDAVAKTEAALKQSKADLEGLTLALPELRIVRAVANDIAIVKTAVENFSKASADALAKSEASEKFFKSVVSANDESKRTAAIAAGEKQAADDKAFSDKQASEKIAAVVKFNAEELKALDQESADKLAAQDKYLGKVADALQAAIDSADAALEKLQQREADLQTGAGRDDDKAGRKAALDDVQAQIKAHRTERDDLKSHLRKIKDIQNRSAGDERDALLDRNFLQLFKLQESKTEQTSAENTAYEQQKQDRVQALSDEHEDKALQYRADAIERRIALQHALSDARLGYNRELQAAAQKRDRALQIAANERDAAISLAEQKRANTIAIAVSEANESVRIASLSADARKMILFAELAQAQQILASMGIYQAGPPTTLGPGSSNPVISSTSTGTITRLAGGGNFRARQPFIFNEQGSSRRERVRVGGGSFGSKTAALVFPLRDGSVDANRGGGSGGNTIHLSIPVSVDARGATDGRALGNQIVAVIQQKVPPMIVDHIATVIGAKVS